MSNGFESDFDDDVDDCAATSTRSGGDFEYEEAASADELLADIDNRYHEAAAGLGADAIAGQDIAGSPIRVLIEIANDTSADHAVLAFKASRRLTKHYLRTHRPLDGLRHYLIMLGFVAAGTVSRNRAEKSIGKILALPAAASIDPEVDFCSSTLQVLLSCNFPRIDMVCRLRLAQAFFARGDYPKLARILPELVAACHAPDGSEDRRRNQDLMEVYSLMIELYSARHDYKQLRNLYHLCLGVRSISPHPRVMGKIYECGGKMYMREKAWNAARTAFFLAFKHYDEAGMSDRIRVLKYLVLASMLDQSPINPFDSPETRPYKDDPCVTALTELVVAHQHQDHEKFESILQLHHDIIMDDPFTREYVDQLKSACLSRTLLHLAKPYTRVSLSFLASTLLTTVDVIESELVALILERKLPGGKIDMLQGCLLISECKSDDDGKPESICEKHDAVFCLGGTKDSFTNLAKWGNQVSRICGMIDARYFSITPVSNGSGQ